ncbi:MAG TPA: glutamine-hydrolyzing carbamoyl-phosphate synthase small subunit [Polyangiaceae bacterium]|nr:glutamine-hydrolyzing carbamoyl-phosphate synthase small subunit [Polyangiaceae bacterium]
MSGRRRAWLALADGTVFEGEAYGAQGPCSGEVVFTTGMTGYQEVLTDPSYSGQLVTMTSPHIGNTGVNLDDPESSDGAPQVAGFIMREASLAPSNWRAVESLDAHLERHGIAAITGVDTRRLTRHIRDKGAQNGCIGSEPPADLVERARSAPPMEGLDLVARVTPKAPYAFDASRGDWKVPFAIEHQVRPLSIRPPPGASRELHVVAMDFGAKRNILRCLVDSGCKVTAVPANASAEQILALGPDGVFLSNGPGDPAAVSYTANTVRALLGKRPIFGICLGHQLLARALGATTYKLKFGHRGLNQPVKDLATGRVEITSQNHGFVVDVDSLKGVARTTHLHLNDGTSEGLEAPEARAFSVQYHPEAAAGPHDSLYLFERFRQLMLAAG